MEIDFWIRLAAVILMLGLSAFFSSLESAYFSLSRSTLDRMRESSDPRAKRVARLMDDPRLLLAAILSGNTVVNTAAAVIAALLALELAGTFNFNANLAVVIEVIVITGAILFFSELAPKMMALKHSEKWAVSTSSAVRAIKLLLLPIAAPLSWITASLSHIAGIEQQSVLDMSESEIRALVQVGHEHGVLELEERRMIHSIFEFGDTTVRNVMVPRIDIVAVEAGVPLQEILETVAVKGHSRIPVYEDTIDNVIGLIYAKDLLPVTQNSEAFHLKSLLRKVHFVPEEKKIDELLREFQTQKVHMALVVDEYGGIDGLVTLEDVLEEIVGEIQDEYDSEQPLTKQVDDKTWMAHGKLGISEFNEKQGFELIPYNEAYDTMAGFVYSQLGVVPKKGQEFDFKGHRFIVEEVHGKRITRIRIIKEGGVFEDV